MEGRRWTIEDAFETAKNELGLDHNETRSWHGWHRHVTLVMTAFAMLAAIRHHANALRPQKDRRRRPARAAPDPLVEAGGPPHRRAPRATTHRARTGDRVEFVATRPSSRSTRSAPYNKTATVMLGSVVTRCSRSSTRARAAEAQLAFRVHALMGKRCSLVVDACLTQANGHDERLHQQALLRRGFPVSNAITAMRAEQLKPKSFSKLGAWRCTSIRHEETAHLSVAI